MEVNKEGNILVLKNGETIIESYDFSKEINFAKLMNFLLGKNLKEEIDFDPKLDDFSDEDKKIVSLIKEIIDEYNLKVKSFKEFCESYKES